MKPFIFATIKLRILNLNYIKMKTQEANVKSELFCHMLEYQGGIFQNAFDNLTDEFALIRPSERSNHSNWLLGHIVHCRFMLAGMIGLEVKNPHEEIYWQAIDNIAYPSIERLNADFKNISSLLINEIGNLTDESLEDNSVAHQPPLAEWISFFAYHEAYHLGQIGYLRKLIGMESLKSN
jgi:hypothetical protein